jgi:hypothetical protein
MILIAVENDDKDLVKIVLTQHPPINSKEPRSGKTSLMIGFTNKFVKIVWFF